MGDSRLTVGRDCAITGQRYVIRSRARGGRAVLNPGRMKQPA